jgi:hypothetical protein
MKSKGYKLHDGWSTWLAHVGFYDWNCSHNKQWTKNVFNQIEPIVFAKNITKFIWLKWLKMIVQNDWDG